MASHVGHVCRWTDAIALATSAARFRVGITTVVCIGAAIATSVSGVGAACAVLAAGAVATAFFWDHLVRRNISVAV